MDKYEYKLKTEQMLELMEDGAYRKAADLADSIDWRRVRNVTMLTNVSDIYAKIKNYEKSYEILNLACRRVHGSRKIISRMCTMALKTGNIAQAEEHYDEFVRVAPKDPNQFILRYQILRARKEPVEQQIEALEEYKKSEYIEKWAYELAKLYQEAGMMAECLEECDDLILWFSEGEYVYQAMELKKQYKPLTPSQQEKYDNRYERSSSDTEEMPNLITYVENADISLEQTKSLTLEEKDKIDSAADTAAEDPLEANRSEGSEGAADEDMKIVPSGKKKIGSTMRLDEALRQLLKPENTAESIPDTSNEAAAADDLEDAMSAFDGGLEDEAESESELREEQDDMTDLEEEIEQIESVADLDIEQAAPEPQKIQIENVMRPGTLSGMKEIIPDYGEEEDADHPEAAEEERYVAEPVDLDITDKEPEEPEEEEVLEESEGEELSEEPDGEELLEEPDGEEVLEESEGEELPEEPDEEEVLEELEREEPSEELNVEGLLDELDEELLEELEGEELPEEPDEEEVLEELEREEPSEELNVEGLLDELDEELLEELAGEELPEELEREEPSEELNVEGLLEELDGELLEEPAGEELPEDPVGEEFLEESAEEAYSEELDEEIFSNEYEEGLLVDDAEDFVEWAEETGDYIIEGDAAEYIMGEDIKKTESILPPDIQRMIDEIEGVIPSEDIDESELEVEEEYPVENMGQVTEELRIDDIEEFDEDDDLLTSGVNEEDLVSSLEDLNQYLDEEDRLGEEYLTPAATDKDISRTEENGAVEETTKENEDLEEPNYFGEGEDLEEPDYFGEGEDLEESDYFGEGEDLEESDYFGEGEDLEESDYFGEGEDLEEPDYFGEGEDLEDLDYFGEGEDLDEDYFGEGDYFSDEEIEENYAPNLEEEFRYNPEHHMGEDDREIPDDEEIDIMAATTPLSRKETAKLIATGKTSPLPLNQISDALSMSDTGFVVHGRYDLETQSGIGTRAGLTEEQKKLFSYFVPVRGMSEQLVDVLEQDKNCTNRKGTSRTGNLLIIGNKGSGKTVLAVDVVKAIQKQRDIRQGKVAIVTGESLNKKKISDIFNKLHGGALIIEKAGSMNEKTVSRLNKAMERDTGELLVVLEEQRKPLDRLLSSNREFRRKFTSRLEVPVFINDELVTFGQTYAQENGYRIDEMGILALYSRIDSLQREDHSVTVAEVKEIMDEAIAHSQKASAKKLMKRVFGRSTDDSDRIILSERDFNI